MVSGTGSTACPKSQGAGSQGAVSGHLGPGPQGPKGHWEASLARPFTEVLAAYVGRRGQGFRFLIRHRLIESPSSSSFRLGTPAPAPQQGKGSTLKRCTCVPSVSSEAGWRLPPPPPQALMRSCLKVPALRPLHGTSVAPDMGGWRQAANGWTDTQTGGDSSYRETEEANQPLGLPLGSSTRGPATIQPLSLPPDTEPWCLDGLPLPVTGPGATAWTEAARDGPGLGPSPRYQF